MKNIPEISAVILDMDGVLWRGDQLLGSPTSTFKLMIDAGIKYAFATNNSTKHINTYVDKLTSFGIPVEPWQVINSSLAAANMLKNTFSSGARLFVIGEQGLIDTMGDAGFIVSDDDPDAVVVGMDRSINYDRLAEASMLRR